MEPTRINSNGRNLTIGVIILGWITCGYLFIRSSQLIKGTVPGFDLCKSIFGSSCDEALQNTASWQLGFPLAGIGLIYFGLLGILFVIHKPFLERAALLLSSAGVGVNLILSIVIFRIGPSCSLCQAVHVINLFVFIAILVSVREKSKINHQKKSFILLTSLKWIFFILLAVTIGSFSEVYILANSVGTKAKAALAQSYDDFDKSPVYAFPKNSSSPVSGSIDAPLQLIVFSSFQCPGCQIFSHSLANLHKKFEGNINIQYKNYPLSSGCNSNLTGNMQPGSCAAALAAIAANNQGLYWEYHDQLFQSDLHLDENSLVAIAKNVGLNIEKWEADRQSELSKEILAEDIRLGNQFKIYATPSVFLNDRQISNVNESAVTFLLQKELDRLKHKK